MHNLTRGHPRVIKKKPHRGLTGGLSPCDYTAISLQVNLTGGLSPCDFVILIKKKNLTEGLSPCDSPRSEEVT